MFEHIDLKIYFSVLLLKEVQICVRKNVKKEKKIRNLIDVYKYIHKKNPTQLIKYDRGGLI